MVERHREIEPKNLQNQSWSIGRLQIASARLPDKAFDLLDGKSIARANLATREIEPDL